MNEATKPCRSPYCECPKDQCSHPGFHDARHIPFEPQPNPTQPALSGLFHTMKNRYTREQLADFREYERVRASGQFNMLSRQAQHVTGLDRDRYVFVQDHYESLSEAAKEHDMTAPA